MTELKCPFCQQELEELYNNGDSVGFRCKNKNCPETNIMCGTKMLWQALIDTKKKLEQSEICCTEWEKQALDYKAENIGLQSKLDIAVAFIEEMAAFYNGLNMSAPDTTVNWDVVAKLWADKNYKTLEQITTEQKD